MTVTTTQSLAKRIAEELEKHPYINTIQNLRSLSIDVKMNTRKTDVHDPTPRVVIVRTESET